ncbi:hypothetical protein [Caballeronia ptereochthonis]|uniref:Uncharacterized protein n=1 Tax=Caballeronia ptereochthonis TaxID=1777144 RepID=A0A158A2N4_9BURK|nr:hypothetical protein [Caballeronia ptereochthonis]SAK51357.1 hypothetical protein AWB83_01208 [Caballeronia ptereochthonis]
MNHAPVFTHHHAGRSLANSVRVLGVPISSYSRALLQTLAQQAHLHSVHVTSGQRAVSDQARIFFQKHVVEGKKASYKNPDVAKIIAHARDLRASDLSDHVVIAYLVRAIEGVHGGPQSISRHLGRSPFVEVFDVAHYSGPTTGAGRHNYMDASQAKAFLEACRKYMGFPIVRLGHSAELGFVRSAEFKDEKCFHFEVAQPAFDRLTVPNGTLNA